MPSLEQLRGAHFRNAPRWDNSSGGANQFAGRTTLQSGSVTVTVSTQYVKADDLIVVGFEGNANFGVKWGSVNINSGSATATVSDAAIAAGSRVFLQPRQNAVAQSSGVNRHVEVLSLGAGSLDIGWADGASISNRLTPVDYLVAPADGLPGTLEVKSISAGNFFTIGFADGRAVARDTILMWQMHHTS